MTSSNKNWFAFVIMPFDKEFDDVYRQLIIPGIQEAGYDVQRADSEIDQRNIIKDIVLKMNASDIVIADLTTLSPNVMYELGIAHTLLKPTVMIIQEENKLPFDISTYNVIFYSVKFNEAGALREKLKEICLRHRQGLVRFDNPIADFLPANDGMEYRNSAEPAIEESETAEWLDVIFEPLEAMQEITKITDAMTEMTVDLTDRMDHHTSEINKISKTQGMGKPASLYKIVKDTSEDMNSYSKSMESQISIISSSWNIFSRNIETVLSSVRVVSEEDRNGLETFKEQLLKLRHSLNTSYPQMQAFRDSVSALPPVSRHLKRASTQVTRTLDRLLREWSMMTSSLAKLLEIVDSRIAEA